MSSQQAATYDRSALLRAVKLQQGRNQYAWSLPFAAISYILFCASLVEHVQVERANELETGLLQAFGGVSAGSSLRSAADVYVFLGTGVVAPLFPIGGDSRARGTINSYGRIVGGLRLGQGRSNVAECPFEGYFHRFSRPCFPADTTSLATFGNTTAAAAGGISSAFIAQTSAALASGADAFQLVIAADEDPVAAAAVVPALAAASWLDAQTKTVTAEVAVLNLDAAAWSLVRLDYTFTRGGRIDALQTITSVPIDPYYGQLSLRFFDVLNLLYLAVLLCQNMFNVMHTGQKARLLVADGLGIVPALRRSIDIWLAIDVGASLSLAATAIQWSAVVVALDALSSTTATRSYSGDSLGTDTAATQLQLRAALQVYATFKAVACATLIFLTMRLFWQFSLQPRLAVMTECLSRASSDLAHFGFLFGVIMVSYCVWGHVIYGRQLDDWRSLAASSFAVVRFTMYDYDLAHMTALDAQSTAVIYGSFMFIVTNLVLWMFFAIVLETYSAVRAEAHGTPSALADIASGIRALPALVRANCDKHSALVATSDAAATDVDAVGERLSDSAPVAVDVQHATHADDVQHAEPVQHAAATTVSRTRARKRQLPTLSSIEHALLCRPIAGSPVVTVAALARALNAREDDVVRTMQSITFGLSAAVYTSSDAATSPAVNDSGNAVGPQLQELPPQSQRGPNESPIGRDSEGHSSSSSSSTAKVINEFGANYDVVRDAGARRSSSSRVSDSGASSALIAPVSPHIAEVRSRDTNHLL